MASENNIQALREARGWSRPQLGERMGTSGQQIERLEKGQRRLTTDWIDKAAEALDVMPAQIIASGDGPANVRPIPTSRPPSDADEDDDVRTVEIEVIDQPWGLGAAFTDIAVQIDKLPFPKAWVETISISPPSLLTWARARGDSMGPTIEDGDLVLLDRSRRKVDEQDALWAFTVGETASIKRLRVKGDRFVILSDNQNVPNDEEPIDFVNIVARVVFVGKRK